MKKKRLNKVLNIVVTLMAAIALMLGNVTSVAAYTDMNGYPFIVTPMNGQFYCKDVLGNVLDTPFVQGVLTDQNTYLFDFNTQINNIREVRFGNYEQSLVIPFNLDQYDYYYIGTIAFTDSSRAEFPSLSTLMFFSVDPDGSYHYVNMDSFSTMDFDNILGVVGQSFYGKLRSDQMSDISNLSQAVFSFSDFATLKGDMWFCASVVPVSKSGSEADTLNSILQTLTQINQNIITGNTLQQQTIDAINQNTTNTSNWFTTLITTLQGWFNTQTENLRTWFYMIEERMSAGFTALYHQMTREQDEKLNGYTDTTQSDAADNFNTESDKLTELEDQLNDQSHDFVSDYTTSGFNTGVLTTLSSSIIFVTTWFANFWNMGGIFTAGLNLCFSLSIVFFILRFRR